jgi:hypothetical protein
MSPADSHQRANASDGPKYVGAGPRFGPRCTHWPARLRETHRDRAVWPKNLGVEEGLEVMHRVVHFEVEASANKFGPVVNCPGTPTRGACQAMGANLQNATKRKEMYALLVVSGAVSCFHVILDFFVT